MAKSAPFTLQLSEELDRWVSEEATRTHLSKGAIIEALAEEGVRMRRFPGIAFRGPDHDRRPWLLGTALDVWEVIEAYQQRDSLESSDLSPRQIDVALAYYSAYPTEIDQAIATNQQPDEAWQRLYPTLVPEG